MGTVATPVWQEQEGVSFCRTLACLSLICLSSVLYIVASMHECFRSCCVQEASFFRRPPFKFLFTKRGIVYVIIRCIDNNMYIYMYILICNILISSKIQDKFLVAASLPNCSL